MHFPYNPSIIPALLGLFWYISMYFAYKYYYFNVFPMYFPLKIAYTTGNCIGIIFL